MKIKNVESLQKFEEAIDKCSGDVWLESNQGDKYNLKSTLCRYVAIGELIKNEGNELELFCFKPEEESYFFDLFNKNLL